jgi:hypothetical protein
MSNNTVLNPGFGGDTISTEDLGASKIQRVKIALGTSGVDGGNISGSNPLPITNGPIIGGNQININAATNQSWNWTGGVLQNIQYTIGANVYQKTFTYTSGNLTNITWSQIA